MILAAIVLFCLAVVLGLWLVVLGMRYRRGSLVLAAGHAGVALLGLRRHDGHGRRYRL